ncbi:MAG: hypothetical protein AAGH60_03910, partial [Pseudomonadota bacterium]
MERADRSDLTEEASPDAEADGAAVVKLAASGCCSSSGAKPAPQPVKLAAASSSCCSSEAIEVSAAAPDQTKPKRDWLLLGSGLTILIAYGASFFLDHDDLWGLGHFAHAIQEMMHLMWWGILVGMVAVGLIDRVPREFVIGVLGRERGVKSLFR